MRTILPGWLLLATLFLSCQKPLFTSIPRSPRTGAPTHGRSSGAPAEEAAPDVPPDVYLTALRFPEGVNWRTDPGGGAQVVLFKNGTECLSVPVAGVPDPERHRVIRGQLWTDESDGARTVVSCNGQERFRHPGAELYRGFLVTGGAVHTLGQRQGWEGLCYRIDGQERFSADIGTLLGSADDREWEGGAFCHDSTGLYYVYGVPIRTADALLWEYKVMCGGQLLRTVPAGSAETLYDIRVLDGTVYRSERRSGGGHFLVQDTQAEPLGLGSRESPHLCKLVAVDGRMLVKGYTGGSSRLSCSFWLRRPGEIFCTAVSMYLITELLYHDGQVAYVALDPDGRLAEIALEKEKLPVPAGQYLLATPRCAAFRKGVLGVALSAAEGDEHLVCLGGECTPYHFNGYFTSLVID